MRKAGCSSSADELYRGDAGLEPRIRELPQKRQPSSRSAEARRAATPRPVAAIAPRSPAGAPSRVAAIDSRSPAAAPSRALGGVPGRRTVTIRGRGAERTPVRYGRPPTRRHERDGFRPDRVAMWAVLLGVLLVLVAVTSSHAAVRSRPAAASPAGKVIRSVVVAGAPAGLSLR